MSDVNIIPGADGFDDLIEDAVPTPAPTDECDDLTADSDTEYFGEDESRRVDSQFTSAAGDIASPDEEQSDAYEDGYQPLIVDGVALPRVASERVRAMSAEQRKLWDSQRLRAKTDSLWFANTFLDMELQDNPHAALFALLPKFQPGIPLTKLSERIKKFMVLWPRGCAKTSIARALIVQLIINYPNVRICFLTGGKPLGKEQLAAVKKYFTHPTAAFRELFPEFCTKSVKNQKTGQWEDRVLRELGTTEHFTVPANTSRVAVEHTMCIVTPNMALSGAHFDVICIDDLVHNKNYTNPGRLARCYQDYKDVSPLLDPQGMMFMFGTRYDQNDTYGLIIQTAAEMGGLSVWKFSIRDCWSKGACTCCGHAEVFHNSDMNPTPQNWPCTHTGCECKGFVGTGTKTVLFPAITKKDGNSFGHTMEFLQAELAEKGQAWFALQYENNPLATGERIFTDALLKSQTLHFDHQLPPLPPANGVNIYMCADLAFSTSLARDESVILLFTVYQGQIFVWGCVFGRWSSNDQVETILRLVRKYRPSALFMEKTQNYGAINDLLTMRAAEPQFNLTRVPTFWTDVSNQKDAKALRTSNVEVALKAQRLFLYAPMPGYDRLCRQLEDFPNSKHDDFSDCLAQVVAAPTGYQNQVPPAVVTAQNGASAMRAYLRLHETPVENQYTDNGSGTGVSCGGGNENWK